MEAKYRVEGVHLKADANNGVQIIEPIDRVIDDPNSVLMMPGRFYGYLKDMEADETIYTYITGEEEEWFDQIKEEYGIHPKKQHGGKEKL